MKHIAEIAPGGFIVDNEYHTTIGEMITQRDEAILALSGNKAIISGVEVDGANTTAGVVTFNGKIYKFVGGVTQTSVTTKRVNFDRPNANQVNAPAFYEDVIEFGDDGFDTFNFDELTRVKTLQEIVELESLVNVAPHWDEVTNKPNFLTKVVNGSFTFGDLGNAAPANYTGGVTSVQVLGETTNDLRMRVNFATIGTTDYIPDIALESLGSNYISDNDIVDAIKNVQSTSFELVLRELAGNVQNMKVRVRIIV